VRTDAFCIDLEEFTCMREYEAMIISKLDLPEAEFTKMFTRWESIISENGGEIIKKDTWGARRLAYPIQKQNRAHYCVYDIATHPKNIHELERVLKFDENVLRSMVINLNDNVDVAQRRLELQKIAEDAARRDAENTREKTESEVLSARRNTPRPEDA